MKPSFQVHKHFPSLERTTPAANLVPPQKRTVPRRPATVTYATSHQQLAWRIWLGFPLWEHWHTCVNINTHVMCVCTYLYNTCVSVYCILICYIYSICKECRERERAYIYIHTLCVYIYIVYTCIFGQMCDLFVCVCFNVYCCMDWI